MKTNKSCPGSTVIALLFLLLCMFWGPGSEALAAIGNETCSTATDLGNLSQGTLILPYSQTGSLNSTQAPDVDYFRITGAMPGSQLTVTLTGVDPGNGVALVDPKLGVYNSKCISLTLASLSSEMAKVVVTVPPDGTVLLEAKGRSGAGGYRIDISAHQPTGSISGTVLDGRTNTTLPSNAYPTVVLDQCFDTSCSSATPLSGPWVHPSTGRFLIDNMQVILDAGTYRVVVNASGYQTLTRVFYAAAGTAVDLGILGLTPMPPVGSISGTFIDQESLKPIRGSGNLAQCFSSDCSSKHIVGSFWVDYAGRFSISRNSWGQRLPAGTYQLRFSDSSYPQRYDNYWSTPLVVGSGENRNVGNLAVAHLPTISSLSGRAVDALTLAALSGTVDPFTKIQIVNCNKLNQCINFSTNADSLGRFTVSQDFAKRPLFAGPTTVTVYATQYQTYKTPQVLDLLAAENRDLGDLKVPSNPIRFTNIKPCSNIPSTGGKCRFSVTLVNGQANQVNATVWSQINAGGLGSFAGSSNFTLGKQTISFGPGTLGSSMTVNFVLDVPAVVADYASFMAVAFVGDEGAVNPFLQPIGAGYLFGMMKAPNSPGFTPVTEREAKELMKKSVEKLDPKPEDDERFREQDRPPVLQGPMPLAL